MPPAAPPYFDFLIDAFRRGDAGRFVHLGHWDIGNDFDADAPPLAGEFARAQDHLNAYLLDMAELAAGQAVLDAGCGFGGTVESINRRLPNMALTGINVDARQLAICREIPAALGNVLRWEQADACRLPFPDSSFDRVLCFEAMFHFDSRRAFYLEAARVLKAGGSMIASDIVLTPSGRAFLSQRPHAVADLLSVYGPWPDLEGRDADHRALAASAGLTVEQMLDATRNTLRSHRFTVPASFDAKTPPANPALRAAWILRELHRQGFLLYLYMRCRKPA